MPDYGITKSGFEIPRMPDIREAVIARVKEKFGVEVYAKPASVMGQLIDVFSETAEAMWEEMHESFRQNHPSYAVGNHLDLAASYTGVTRKPAGKTVGYARIIGSEGALVQKGSALRDSVTNIVYLTDAERFIDRNSANSITLEPQMAQDTEYWVEIGGQRISYRTGSTSSPTGLLRDMAARAAAIGYAASVSNGSITISIQPPALFRVSNSGNMVMHELATAVGITAEDNGEFSLSQGSSLQTVSQIAGVASAYAPLQGVSGSPDESDASLRARYHSSLFSPGRNTAAAIRAAIEQRVLGVTACRVFDNKTGVSDDIGRPGHSVHAVVMGGKSTDIAEVIMANVAGGVDTFGAESSDLKDMAGETVTIRFDRPAVVYVWIAVDVTHLPLHEERYPSNSADEIRSMIVDGAKSSHNIGTDVVAGRVASFAYSHQGVARLDLKMYKTTNPLDIPSEKDYQAGNLDILDNQIAVFDESRVIVT